MNKSTRPVVIYGAGGHGRVVLDALQSSGRAVGGFVDDASDRLGREVAGHPVFDKLGATDLGEDFQVVVAIGSPSTRERITATVLELGLELATAIHPSATVAPDVTVEPGVMVLAQAAVNTGTHLGRGAIINTGAVVDHDCVVGAFAHVGPGARLAGGVKVGDRALVGVGSTVVQGVEIGSDAVVGAGAAVIARVEVGSTVVGVPARALESRPSRRISGV